MSNKKNCIIPVYNRKCLLENDKDLRVFFDWFFAYSLRTDFRLTPLIIIIGSWCI